MKAYIIVEDWVLNGEKGDLEIKGYSNKEKAENEFKRRVEQAREDLSHISCVVEDDITTYRGETTFSIYEDGCYDRAHVDIKLKEMDFEEE